MRTVFLSHSFAARDRELVTLVENLIRSHNLMPTTGRALGGAAITPEVARRIEDSDALIALHTHREGEPTTATHPWVVQEFAHAKMSNKPAIAVYQQGVTPSGAGIHDEHILLDVGNPAPALVRLSETIGEWKRQAGRLVKVQLLPVDVANRIGRAADAIQCQYRWQASGADSAWQRAVVRREVGGVIAYLRVPDDDTGMIQLQANGHGLNCESAFTPLRMFVELDPRE